MRQIGGNASRGFTITELLIVVAIIALITAIFVPVYLGQRDRARDALVKQNVQTVAMGLRLYNLDHSGSYPLAVSGPHGTHSLVDSSGVPYIDAWPENPWTGDPIANIEHYSKGDFQYTGYSSVAGLQATGAPVDKCSLLGWVTSESQPYVASAPGPHAVPVDTRQ